MGGISYGERKQKLGFVIMGEKGGGGGGRAF